MKVLKPKNYRGELTVKEEDSKYYVCVSCNLYNDHEWEWEEISSELYYLLIKELSI